MYRLQLLALAFGSAAIAVSAQPSFAFTSDTTDAIGFPALPDWDVTGAGVPECTLSSTGPYPYAVFTFTVTAANFYQIMLDGDSEIYDELQAYMFVHGSTPFNGNVANPCNLNFYQNRTILNQNQANEDREWTGGFDIMWLAPGEYDLVVTTYYTTGGKLSANIWQANMWNSTLGGPWYLSPSGSGPCSFESDGQYNVTFAVVSWTASATGVVDIFIGFDFLPLYAYDSLNDDFYLESQLYQGIPTESNLQSSVCGSGFIQQQEGTAYGLGVVYYQISVTAGQVYSLVVSGSATGQSGRFGVWVRPTAVQTLVGTWTTPDLGATPSDCTSNDGYTSSYSIVTFTAAAATPYIISYTESVVPGDTRSAYFFLYTGTNSAPTACPGNQYVTQDSRILFTATAGVSYTVVVSTYDDDVGNYTTAVFITTGTFVPATPATSTTGTTGHSGSGLTTTSTGTTSTGHGSGSGGTTQGAVNSTGVATTSNVTGHGSTTTTTTTTTTGVGAASSLVASLTVVLAALVAALLA